MENKIIKCENDFALSLSRNYSVNELRVLSTVLYKISSILSKEKTLEFAEDNDLLCIRNENNDLTVAINFEIFKKILYKSNADFATVRNICFKLCKIDFNYYSQTELGKVWNVIPIFKKISFLEYERIFYFELNEHFEIFINDLVGDFILYDLEEFKELSTEHSQQLYLIGRRYVNLNNGNLRIKLETLREWFNIENKYERIHDISKFIDRNIKHIEENTALKIKWNKEKVGRSIKYVNFNFKYEKELYKENII